MRCSVAGSLDGLGDDFNQRHAGTVVIDQRTCGTCDPARLTTDVGQLPGVFFHVCSLDVHAPGTAVIQWHVEVAVDSDRLVVLRNLIVLRLVGVEIVLPGESAPRHDLAVQRQSDPDRRLDRGPVEDRQRARQAQTYRAHLGVGLGAEDGGAPAEHLGHGGQLYVHLKAQYWIKARQNVLVRQQFNRCE